MQLTLHQDYWDYSSTGSMGSCLGKDMNLHHLNTLSTVSRKHKRQRCAGLTAGGPFPSPAHTHCDGSLLSAAPSQHKLNLDDEPPCLAVARGTSESTVPVRASPALRRDEQPPPLMEDAANWLIQLGCVSGLQMGNATHSHNAGRATPTCPTELPSFAFHRDVSILPGWTSSSELAGPIPVPPNSRPAQFALLTQGLFKRDLVNFLGSQVTVDLSLSLPLDSTLGCSEEKCDTSTRIIISDTASLTATLRHLTHFHRL